jgi:tRNA isopentenyl-2-thiomethyl-A-37 hydroxylase MiaE
MNIEAYYLTFVEWKMKASDVIMNLWRHYDVTLVQKLTRRISNEIFRFWKMRRSGVLTNVLKARLLTWSLVTGLLVHIHQKEKIALGIAAKIDKCKGGL